jgi:hypothetical protein
MSDERADYLVVGAGAAALAFVDALVARSSAQVLVVDRRGAAGGHWKDAYPFVRLHQPSAFYGVDSSRLGQDRRDGEGPNAGFYERATGPEVLAYLQAAAVALEATGRVRFLFGHNYVGDFESVHALRGPDASTIEVTVTRRVVDARYLEGDIPATHHPSFEVARDTRLLTPTDVAHLGVPARTTVLGAGKTAMDIFVHLLEAGADPAGLRWVRPRDAWLFDRRQFQPLELVGSTVDGQSRALEAVAQAESPGDLFARLEECGHLRRLDPSATPTMFHCATVNDYEVQQLRTVGEVVRAGHVRRLERDRMVLEGATIPVASDESVVDATSAGLSLAPARTIFEPTRITLQQVRSCQPTFNAALVGVLESLDATDDERNRLAPPNPYPSRDLDWLANFDVTNRSQSRWMREPRLAEWLLSTRLNMVGAAFIRLDDPEVSAALERFAAFGARARDNGARLLATAA